MATGEPDTLTAPFIALDRESVLSLSLRPEIGLAIWRRRVPDCLALPLDALELDTVDDIEIRLPVPVAPGALEARLVEAGYPPETAELLARDIAALAERLPAAPGVDGVKVRLEVVETDACRKFHADVTRLRLITTYRGQGTQWRRAEDEVSIEQLQAGEVGIFKGRLLMEEPSILHRSPPISHTREQRLVLVIDHDPAR